MTMADFHELLAKYNVELETEPTADTPVSELGIDSFDIMMILGDLENEAGKSLDLTFDLTVGELLQKVSQA